MKTRICLFVIVVANALGNVALSHGMKQVGSVASYSPLSLVASSLRAMANPYVMVGIGLLLIFFIAHTIVLTWADLSYILPMTSVGYILVTILSWWWLGETVGLLRWAGTIVIIVGVALVSRSPASTSPAARAPAVEDPCPSSF